MDAVKSSGQLIPCQWNKLFRVFPQGPLRESRQQNQIRLKYKSNSQNDPFFYILKSLSPQKKQILWADSRADRVE